MTVLILVVHIIVSFVLIAVILLQAGKGGGLSDAFGGTSQQIFGTKSSAFLNRATSVCAILFLVTCLSLGALSSRGRRSLLEQVKPEAPKPTQTKEASVPGAGDTQPPSEKKTPPPTPSSTP